MVLTHDAIVQDLLGIGQFLAFLRLDITHRDAGHLGHDVAHSFLVELVLFHGLTVIAGELCHLTLDLCR